MSALAPTLQAFFTDRLTRQRQACPQTIAAYRDTWRLLLTFAYHTTGKQPAEMDIADLDASLIGEFLDHLEHDRRNSPRTRNARLAAIHSLFGYAALQLRWKAALNAFDVAFDRGQLPPLYCQTARWCRRSHSPAAVHSVKAAVVGTATCAPRCSSSGPQSTWPAATSMPGCTASTLRGRCAAHS